MRTARRIYDLLVVILSVLVLGLALSNTGHAQSTITYAYDELGRLVGVVNPSGNAAVYNYDAVGNILSISQYPSSTVSIISFSPSSGPSGATVTISGTGFSTTPSQNSVTFNGTGGTVTSSTATQIVATVPSSATSGPIGVTVTGHSASSAKPFTISSLLAPTISSFSPTVGIQGTLVAIAGTNFQAAPVLNNATFNAHPGLVSTATPTNLSAPVPSNAGSGHIAVSTPSGTGVSNADFYVAPPPYAASSISPVGVGSGRLLIGGSATVSVGAGQVGLMLFDGIAGQRVSALFSNGTFPSCSANTYLLNTNGATFINGSCLGTSAFVDATTLPIAGTYAIELGSQGTGAGSASLQLYNVVDASAPITVGGSGSVTNTVPGQNGRLAFTLSQSQKISAFSSVFDGGAYTTCNTSNILDANGNLVDQGWTGGFLTWGCTGSFMDARTLSAGSYTIVIDPPGSGTNLSLSANLYSIADVTGSVTINGKSKTLSATTGEGQNLSVTFSGSAGQLATVHLSSSSFTTQPAGGINVTLFSTDGTTRLLPTTFTVSSSLNLSQVTLPNTGTYTIYIDPQGPYGGSITVAVTSP